MNRLPDDVAEAMRVMHRRHDPRLTQYMAWMQRQNWSATQIAEPLGQSRQAVNQRVARWLAAHDGTLPNAAPRGLPKVPFRRPDPKAVPVVRHTHTLPVVEAATMAGLWMMSSRVRNRTPKDHPGRQASVEFDRRLVELLRSGYSLAQISHDIGVEERAIRVRMNRHGLTVAAIREGAA